MSQLSNRWVACPADYDYINMIDLCDDEVCEGGGQSIDMRCHVEWTSTHNTVDSTEDPPVWDYEKSVLVETGTLDIKYLHDPDDRYCPDLDASIGEDSKSISYQIYTGRFIFHHLYGGPCRYNLKVVFNECPIPYKKWRDDMSENGSEIPSWWDELEYYSGGGKSPDNYWWKQWNKMSRRLRLDWSSRYELSKQRVEKYFPHTI